MASSRTVKHLQMKLKDLQRQRFGQDAGGGQEPGSLGKVAPTTRSTAMVAPLVSAPHCSHGGLATHTSLCPTAAGNSGNLEAVLGRENPRNSSYGEKEVRFPSAEPSNPGILQARRPFSLVSLPPLRLTPDLWRGDGTQSFPVRPRIGYLPRSAPYLLEHAEVMAFPPAGCYFSRDGATDSPFSSQSKEYVWPFPSHSGVSIDPATMLSYHQYPVYLPQLPFQAPPYSQLDASSSLHKPASLQPSQLSAFSPLCSTHPQPVETFETDASCNMTPPTRARHLKGHANGRKLKEAIGWKTSKLKAVADPSRDTLINEPVHPQDRERNGRKRFAAGISFFREKETKQEKGQAACRGPPLGSEPVVSWKSRNGPSPGDDIWSPHRTSQLDLWLLAPPSQTQGDPGHSVHLDRTRHTRGTEKEMGHAPSSHLSSSMLTQRVHPFKREPVAVKRESQAPGTSQHHSQEETHPHGSPSAQANLRDGPGRKNTEKCSPRRTKQGGSKKEDLGSHLREILREQRDSQRDLGLSPGGEKDSQRNGHRPLTRPPTGPEDVTPCYRACPPGHPRCVSDLPAPAVQWTTAPPSSLPDLMTIYGPHLEQTSPKSQHSARTVPSEKREGFQHSARMVPTEKGLGFQHSAGMVPTEKGLGFQHSTGKVPTEKREGFQHSTGMVSTEKGERFQNSIAMVNIEKREGFQHSTGMVPTEKGERFQNSIAMVNIEKREGFQHSPGMVPTEKGERFQNSIAMVNTEKGEGSQRSAGMVPTEKGERFQNSIAMVPTEKGEGFQHSTKTVCAEKGEGFQHSTKTVRAEKGEGFQHSTKTVWVEKWEGFQEPNTCSALNLTSPGGLDRSSVGSTRHHDTNWTQCTEETNQTEITLHKSEKRGPPYQSEATVKGKSSQKDYKGRNSESPMYTSSEGAGVMKEKTQPIRKRKLSEISLSSPRTPYEKIKLSPVNPLSTENWHSEEPNPGHGLPEEPRLEHRDTRYPEQGKPNSGHGDPEEHHLEHRNTLYPDQGKPNSGHGDPEEHHLEHRDTLYPDQGKPFLGHGDPEEHHLEHRDTRYPDQGKPNSGHGDPEEHHLEHRNTWYPDHGKPFLGHGDPEEHHLEHRNTLYPDHGKPVSGHGDPEEHHLEHRNTLYPDHGKPFSGHGDPEEHQLEKRDTQFPNHGKSTEGHGEEEKKFFFASLYLKPQIFSGSGGSLVESSQDPLLVLDDQKGGEDFSGWSAQRERESPERVAGRGTRWPGIQVILETYRDCVEETFLEERFLQEQLTLSEAKHQELRSMAQSLSAQLKELEASKERLARENRSRGAELANLQRCLTFTL